MSKLTIETSIDVDGKVNVNSTFEDTSNVMELMNAMETTHALLLKKLNKYSKSVKKRMNVTIAELLENEKS